MPQLISVHPGADQTCVFTRQPPDPPVRARAPGNLAAACAKHSVALNMGTNRRHDTGYDAACDLIHSGEIGALKSIVVHSTSALFNGQCEQP